ncbi:hypothetical protein [Neokomagataea anthophila]|uniref:Uncharacterized protein n=1 Tax=Neokomagataea anthophila TaxID=2826925 RepID=A0ABS5E4T7_9PROT|nr:hypothetical protein [Neokomagataea anthophila]MBR0558914.1 hypothetical protein [Neokomagataea anthophila]
MKNSAAATSLYLMDWHGHFLSHDPMRDRFSVSPFNPGILPDLTINAPKHFSLPTDIQFIKHISMPKPFPTCIMDDAGGGYVSLFFPQKQRYLTCLPIPEQQEQAVIRAEFVHGWEKFIPFTPAALRGLSLLMLPELYSIISKDGRPVSALTLHPHSNIGSIDGFNISIVDNIRNFDLIGKENTEINLINQENSEKLSLTIHKK